MEEYLECVHYIPMLILRRVCMKEEFHARFATILQILYQKKMLTYFNNQIVITFDLINRGQLVNWCSIMLTQLLVELIRWIEH